MKLIISKVKIHVTHTFSMFIFSTIMYLAYHYFYIANPINIIEVFVYFVLAVIVLILSSTIITPYFICCFFPFMVISSSIKKVSINEKEIVIHSFYKLTMPLFMYWRPDKVRESIIDYCRYKNIPVE